jgi:ketosteroid isomerase-like protein
MTAKVLKAGLVVFVLAGILAGTAVAQDGDADPVWRSDGGGGTAGQVNLEIVEAYQDAVNRGDLEAIMALFAEDAVLTMTNVPVLIAGEQVPLWIGPELRAPFLVVNMDALVGKAQIRAYHDYSVGIDTELQVDNCTVTEGTVACTAIETDDWLSAAGLAPSVYTSAVFTVEDGLIREVRVTLSPESAQATTQTLWAFGFWVMENSPDEFARLFTPDGKYIHSCTCGELAVRLAQGWGVVAAQP